MCAEYISTQNPFSFPLYFQCGFSFSAFELFFSGMTMTTFFFAASKNHFDRRFFSFSFLHSLTQQTVYEPKKNWFSIVKMGIYNFAICIFAKPIHFPFVFVMNFKWTVTFRVESFDGEFWASFIKLNLNKILYTEWKYIDEFSEKQ